MTVTIKIICVSFLWNYTTQLQSSDTRVLSSAYKSTQVPSFRHTPVSPLWGHLPFFFNPIFFPQSPLPCQLPPNLSTNFFERTSSTRCLYFLVFCSYANPLSQASRTKTIIALAITVDFNCQIQRTLFSLRITGLLHRRFWGWWCLFSENLSSFSSHAIMTF